VIPTCVDLDRFTLEQGEPHPFTLGYVGSVGTWYLLDQMLHAFVHLRDRVAGSRLLLVNRGDHDFIRERAAAQGIAGEELELVEASHLEMPRLISRMSAGMALYKSGYSRVACSPTKVGEYLACGVPCLASAAVGDLKEILEASGVGVALTGYSDAEMMSAVERIVSLAKDEGIRERCRTAATHFYSLSDGVSTYGRIYTRLSKSTPGPRP
jgi:glycosyltransferase involved in cell wall biosynthesis